jgi:hypothetical protein
MTTPQEILTELRDIHLPAVADAQTPLSLDPRPFIVLAAIVVIIAIIRHLRATQWRREAKRRLQEIAAISDTAQAQSALTTLLSAIPDRARLSTLPDSVFRTQDSAKPEDVTALRAHVEDVLAGKAT